MLDQARKRASRRKSFWRIARRICCLLVLLPIGGCTSVFELPVAIPDIFDSFDVTSDAWELKQNAKTDQHISNGALRIEVLDTNYPALSILNTGPVSPEFVCEALGFIGNDYNGVGSWGICWGAPRTGTYTAVMLRSDGKYSVRKRTPSVGWTDIVDWTFHSSIKQDAGPNTIRIETSSNSVSVYVNDINLGEHPVTAFPHAEFAVVAECTAGDRDIVAICKWFLLDCDR